MADLIHLSKFRIVQLKRPLRHAFLEGFEQPIEFGVHGGIKKFYQVEPERDVPSTLDYVVGAVAG